MQKFLFILILSLLGGSVSAQNESSPPITINESSIRVGKLLKEISRQSGHDFSYNSRILDARQTISFQVEDASLQEVLNTLSRKIGVAFQVFEGQIILTALEEPEPEEEFFTLSGFLSDKSTGENLMSASIYIKNTGRGALTNEFGYYALSLKKGTYTIVYSYVGFEAVEEKIELKNDTRKMVALPPASIDLPEIVVALPIKEMLPTRQPGALQVSPTELNSLPEFGGESGLVKGLQSLPGIKSHSDGSAFFYTRGGERDQNLVIIDDAPIYNPSHLLGFYSMIIPDFAKNITVYKSDMPANIGDRLSSIISIRTKDGNLNKFSLGAAFNPLVSRLSIETPIKKQKSSLYLSLRRSTYEWLFQNAVDQPQFFFQDFHLKWNWKINDKNRLFFTTIQGRDVLAGGTGAVNGFRWGNSAATVRWNHIFGPKLFSNTTMYSGNYSYNVTVVPNHWKSELGSLSLKTDFTHFAGPKYTSRFGFEVIGYFTNPGELSIDSSTAVLPNLGSDYSRKGVLYYQGAFELGKKWTLNSGFRLTNWQNLGPTNYVLLNENHEPEELITAGAGVYNNYVNLDPRLSLEFQVDSTSMLKFSYGRYSQYLQLILNSIGPFSAFEVWLPASPNIKPQTAQQFSLDYTSYYQKPGIGLSASAYYKLAQNQIEYAPHAITYLNPLLEGELRFGTSQAYGLEVMFKKERGKLNGWIAYTWSRVFRNTPELNGGNSYPAFQDRPHDLSVVLNWQMKPRVLFSAYWTSYSGSTFTSPTGFYEFNGETIPVFGERNNDRLPTYHRMDIAFKFQLNKKPEAKYKHDLTLSVYNVLAHKNVYSIKFNKLESDAYFPRVPSNVLLENTLSASQIDLIRFFPSLTYTFKIN
ncbi:MAG: TonB-dependent receptor [Bacteroidetes bacterium]|nr:TonB-dependent receptor [Bacteroidota bacterium]